jgi:hypothetical protein
LKNAQRAGVAMRNSEQRNTPKWAWTKRKKRGKAFQPKQPGNRPVKVKVSLSACLPKTAFRIHPDRERTVSGIYLSHLDGKWWIIAADVVEEEGIEFPNLWRADLYEGLKRNGQRFVLPVTLPLLCNKTDWHDPHPSCQACPQEMDYGGI